MKMYHYESTKGFEQKSYFFFLLFIFLMPVSAWAQQVPSPDLEWHVCGSYNDPSSCATVFIVLGDGNNEGKPVNPVVFVEGWDPDNDHSMGHTWNRLGGEGSDSLLSELLRRGQDIVLVDWDDPYTQIQENGMTLASILAKIGLETSNNATCGEPVVVGTSMGGLVSRWALLHREHHGGLEVYPMRSFVSFDTPHKGANSPLAMQALAKEFNFVSAIEEKWDDISRGSAQQMFLSHIQGDDYQAHADRRQFVNELSDMGDFPIDMRKVAIANGSCTGKSQGYSGGDRVAMLRVPVWIAQGILPGTPIIKYNARLFAYPDPDEGKGYVYRTSVTIMNPLFPWVPMTILDNKYYPRRSRDIPSYDVVPGGRIDFWGKLEEDSRLTEWLITTTQDDACIVPTISALYLDTNDYFYDVRDDPDDLVDKTPFNDIYCQADNQFHVSFTEANIDFIINEIAPHNLELKNSIVRDGVVDKRASVDNITVSRDGSGYIVKSGGKVELKATDTIRLKPGFHAEEGSSFHAQIGSCGVYND